MDALDSTAVARMGLILGHLLAFALAAVGIALGDLALFRKRQVDADMLGHAKQVVKWALYALWATGLAVIWLDTRFDLAVLASKPKLLAKLTVAVALSANGWLLHRVVFQRFTVAQDDPERAANERKKIGRLWVRIVPHGVMATIGQVACFNRVAVAK